jgi:hypothetical protein
VQIKEGVLLLWTAHLFTSPHRCIISLVADKHFRSEPLPIAEVEKFRNGLDLLRDLEAGLLVKTVRKQRGAANVAINRDFFTLLPKLIEKLASTLDPAIARLQLFASNGDLRICRGCKTLRSQQEI